MGEISVVLDCLYCILLLCPNVVRIMTDFLTFYEDSMNEKTKHRSVNLHFGVLKKTYLSELTLLCASSLRLLAALDARAFIMLTLAELGKHTSLGTGTLESSQSAVQGLIFLDMDFRHRFPSLRAFGSIQNACAFIGCNDKK